MIFSVKDTFEKVQNGTKDVTRRLWKAGDRYDFEDGKIIRVYRSDRLLYEVGRDYAVQSGRGIEGEGRMELLSIEVDHNPGYMGTEEARREGFDQPDDFKAAWVAMYGEAALWKRAYRLEFKMLEGVGAA